MILIILSEFIYTLYNLYINFKKKTDRILLKQYFKIYVF